MLKVKEDAIYKKYSKYEFASKLFYYILKEYHDQPLEFTQRYCDQTSGEDILNLAFKCKNYESAINIIDDFIIDEFYKKPRGWRFCLVNPDDLPPTP